jgi:hypothetical protein
MTAPTHTISRGRRIAATVLIVLATLIAIVSTLTLWVDRQLLDNGAWATASEEVIQDPSVQQALGVYLVNQLYSNVDVAASLRERLPANLDPLAAPLAGALREPAGRTVSQMLARPRVQNLWVNASATMHEKLVNVLEDKTGAGISTGNGVVTIQTGTLIRELATELGLSGKAVSKIPPTAGTITVLKSSQLSAAQNAVQVNRALSRWLLVLVIAMYAIAAYIARGRRRLTVRAIGWSLVGVGLAVLVARKVIGNYVINAITSREYRDTGHHLWLITTSVLGDIGWAAIFYGVLFVLAMALAGPTRPAVALRRAVGPIVVRDPFVPWGAAALFLLLLVLWGGTHALRTWWGIAIAAILLAIGVVAFRRQLSAELEPPPAQPETPQTKESPETPVLT